jgi:hypothetical protein
VWQVARGAVDLREQQRLALAASAVDDGPVDVERVAHPQVAGEFVDEAPALRAGAAQRPPRDAMRLQQPMHRGLRQRPSLDLLRALQRSDDSLHRASWLLLLEPENE